MIKAMRLKDYLDRYDETQSEFGRRADVATSTIQQICAGGGAGALTAAKIIEASGGIVTLADLQPRKRKKGTTA